MTTAAGTRMRWDEILARLPADRLASVAEVGVWRGQCAAHLLASGRLARLLLVDVWRPADPDSRYARSGDSKARASLDTFARAFAQVRALRRQAPDVVEIRRVRSTTAARDVLPASLDLVFIDAEHTRLAVAADIAAWWPAVAPGGWLGGHDYGNGRYPGVAAAAEDAFPGRVTVAANMTWWVQRKAA